MKQTLKTFFIFFIPLLILYYPTRNAGFVTDFLGWQTAYENHSFWQILDGKDHNIKSFYHFTHILMYIMSSLFGIKGLGWYVVQCAMIAGNGVLARQLCLNVGRIFGQRNLETASTIGILFWLASPYLAEVAVWRAAFHYPLAFGMQLAYILLALKFIETQEKRYVYWATALFIPSLFSLEFFFVTPFMVLSILLFMVLNNQATFKHLLKPFFAFFMIPILGIIMYMVTYHARYGKWVAHNRQEDAPVIFFNLDAYSTYAKYIAKHLFFLRHLNEANKVAIFDFFRIPTVAIIITATIILANLLGILKFRRLTDFQKLTFSCFAFLSLTLVPVVTLSFERLLLTENDRYGYTPSLFLMLILALCLFKLPKHLFYTCSGLYICFSLFLTVKTNKEWTDASSIYWHLIDNYHWQDTQNVVLLNVPDCLNGMYMFRHYDYKSAFTEAYDLYKGKHISTKTQEAMRYNMMSAKDGAFVIMDSPDTLHVVLGQYGSWWMMKSWGVENYETENYKVRFGDFLDYKLILKPSPKKYTYLYQVGSEWKVVDTAKLHIEQR